MQALPRTLIFEAALAGPTASPRAGGAATAL